MGIGHVSNIFLYVEILAWLFSTNLLISSKKTNIHMCCYITCEVSAAKVCEIVMWSFSIDEISQMIATKKIQFNLTENNWKRLKVHVVKKTRNASSTIEKQAHIL